MEKLQQLGFMNMKLQHQVFLPSHLLSQPSLLRSGLVWSPYRSGPDVPMPRRRAALEPRGVLHLELQLLLPQRRRSRSEFETPGVRRPWRWVEREAAAAIGSQ